MLHGIALGGGALLALAATLSALYLLRPAASDNGVALERSGAIAALTSLTAVSLWAATLVGTYVVFPPYRATPPDGTTDLAPYPRSMILSDPSTEWLHAFAMETKEHLPFVACMLATAVAFVAWRYRSRLIAEPGMRRIGSALLSISFVIVAYISLLGVFINKVAPLE